MSNHADTDINAAAEAFTTEDFLAPIPGVPAGRKAHDIDEAWLSGRDSEAEVLAVAEEAVAQAAEFPTKLVSRPSRKYTGANRNKTNVYYVLIHSSEGSYYGAIDWLLNGPVSASYCLIVNEAGTEATQLVASTNIAWAGGTSHSNTYGIHICMAGYGSKGFSDAQMKATAKWARYFADKYEVPVRFAFDVNASTRRQLVRAGIGGHEHIPGADHTDPFTDSQPYHANMWKKFLSYMGANQSKPAPSPSPSPKPAPNPATSYRILASGKQQGVFSVKQNAVNLVSKLMDEHSEVKVERSGKA